MLAVVPDPLDAKRGENYDQRGKRRSLNEPLPTIT